MALTKIDDRGLKTPIDLLDNEKIRFGTGNDLEIYHDGANSVIKNTTGDLIIEDTGGNLIFRPKTGEDAIKAYADGSVELYHNNVLRLNTSSSGVDITGELYIPDNTNIKIGGGGDLLIYHDGSHSYISDTGTGYLKIRGSEIQLQSTGGADMAKFVPAGAVELYHDNSKKFETISTGAKVHGANLQLINTESSGDAQLFLQAGEGASAYVTLYADDGDNGSDKFRIRASDSSGFYLENLQSGSWETNIKALGEDSAELYFDNSKKLNTRSDGVDITGILNMSSHIYLGDSDYLICGASNDLQIYHDGSNTYYKNNYGWSNFNSDKWWTGNYANNERYISAQVNSGVEICYDGVKKFETTSSGVTVTGTVSDSKGDLRKLANTTVSSAYTLVAADAGKYVLTTSGNITVPDSVFSAGDMVTLINHSSGDITINKGTNMYNAADGTNTNRTLAGKGMATLLFTDSATCYISGAGLS